MHKTRSLSLSIFLPPFFGGLFLRPRPLPTLHECSLLSCVTLPPFGSDGRDACSVVDKRSFTAAEELEFEGGFDRFVSRPFVLFFLTLSFFLPLSKTEKLKNSPPLRGCPPRRAPLVRRCRVSVGLHRFLESKRTRNGENGGRFFSKKGRNHRVPEQGKKLSPFCFPRRRRRRSTLATLATLATTSTSSHPSRPLSHPFILRKITQTQRVCRRTLLVAPQGPARPRDWHAWVARSCRIAFPVVRRRLALQRLHVLDWRGIGKIPAGNSCERLTNDLVE